MLDVLIAGRVRGTPEAKRSAGGKDCTRFRVLVPTAESEAVLASCVAFGEVAKAVAALADGDAISITGSAKLTHWTGKDGGVRVGLDLVASAVLTAYAVRRRRAAVAGGEPD